MYGPELALDVTGVKSGNFTYDVISKFVRDLCDNVLKVERVDGFYFAESEPGDSTEGNLKTQGFSAAQFLITSSVVLHGLPLTGDLYINVFTCGALPEARVCGCIMKWFGGVVIHSQLLKRGAGHGKRWARKGD